MFSQSVPGGIPSDYSWVPMREERASEKLLFFFLCEVSRWISVAERRAGPPIGGQVSGRTPALSGCGLCGCHSGKVCIVHLQY